VCRAGPRHGRLRGDRRFSALVGGEQLPDQHVADGGRQLLQQLARLFRVLVEGRRNPKPNSALSSKSEFDQAGPRPSRLVVNGVVAGCRRRSRSIGGIRDEGAVAEQLREQFHVRRFATARTGARVLEERFEELRAFHVDGLHRVRSGSGRLRKKA